MVRARWSTPVATALLLVVCAAVVEAYFPFQLRALEPPTRLLTSAQGWQPLLPVHSDDVLADVTHLALWLVAGTLVVFIRRPPLPVGPATVVTAFVAGLLVLGKLAFVGRHPGLADLVTQPGGVVLGALVGAWFVRRRGVGLTR